MRKHSVRKWLHAILDLLPVIILPIFAIYSHRHTIDSYEVTVPQNEVVNFNQLAPNELNPYYIFSFQNNGDFVVEEQVQSTSVFNGSVGNNVLANIQSNHFYYLNIVSDFDSPLVFNFYVGSQYGNGSYVLSFNNDWVFVLGFSPSVEVGTYHCYINIIDLTVMFGSGNEPTLEQFETWYPKQYYLYNTGTKQLLKNVSTVTYDNSDIGSQMMYSLYKPINDYFNLNNVFNFGAIYDWFELNMFNGNAPLSIFIVWNIIVYEFIMDIIFLIYSVFMFVIDFACETLDRFTGWAKRGD